MFLAAEWNRSSVSERAYLLAMLCGREFEVEANDLSLQIASLAMTWSSRMDLPLSSRASTLARRTDGHRSISKPLNGIAC